MTGYYILNGGLTMNDKRYEHMRGHLNEIMPQIEEFSKRHDFFVVNPESIGWYPRIRIIRPSPEVIDYSTSGVVRHYFDLMCCLDESGKRYRSFFEEIPYDLDCGASVDYMESNSYGTRFWKGFLIFERQPYSQIASKIGELLESNWPKIKPFSVEFLKNQGKRIELGR